MNNIETNIDYVENDENKLYQEDGNIVSSNLNEKENDLLNKEWYWSNISRSQANDLLHGKKDGTFLVRDSINKSNYTLTVKKDGINKMMRIICKNGKYGFRDPPQFDSLQNLIEYYTENSLAEYSSEMDIRLEHSLTKNEICSSLSVNPEKIDEELFILAYNDYQRLILEYDEYHKQYKNCQDEIQKFKQNLNCLEETFAIFQEQIKLNEENEKEAMAHEKSDLAMHHGYIEENLSNIEKLKKQLEKECEEKNNKSTVLDRKINELKPFLNEKKRFKEQIRAILINKIGNEKIEKIIEFLNNNIYSNFENFSRTKLSDNYDQGQKGNYCLIDQKFLANACSFNGKNSTNVSYSPLSYQNKFNQHSNLIINNIPKVYGTNDDQNDESNYLDSDNQNFEKQTSLIDAEWYVGDLSREDVNLIMKNQPDGTFLVKDSKNKAETPFTLTIRLNGSTKMLRILKSHDNYYGFEPDKLEFDSVIKLIEYYLNKPLIFIKPELTIRLLYPITKEKLKI